MGTGQGVPTHVIHLPVCTGPWDPLPEVCGQAHQHRRHARPRVGDRRSITDVFSRTLLPILHDRVAGFAVFPERSQ